MIRLIEAADFASTLPKELHLMLHGSDVQRNYDRLLDLMNYEHVALGSAVIDGIKQSLKLVEIATQRTYFCKAKFIRNFLAKKKRFLGSYSKPMDSWAKLPMTSM